MYFNIPKHNLDRKISTLQDLIQQYKTRIDEQLAYKETKIKKPKTFLSFALNNDVNNEDDSKDTGDEFIVETPNQILSTSDYLSECGNIFYLEFSPEGKFLIVGHSTGLIQAMSHEMKINELIKDYQKQSYYNDNIHTKISKIMFNSKYKKNRNKENQWIKENYRLFLRNTPNKTLFSRWYFSECGFISALEYSCNGKYILTGHASGLIQMRHGKTGTVLSTLRNVQFPHKPIYAIQHSKAEERICYAACSDGAIYRVEIPNIITSIDDPPEFCIRADPALESLNMQFYGAPGISSHSTPFVTQRVSALCLGISADQNNIIAGYSDGSIKVFDIPTQETVVTYKVHKLRLQFIPVKLQRNHIGRVCALKCHPDRTHMFASGAWDETLRIWDIRCKVGCVMTFEAGNICSDSIDLNRDHCITGAWSPIEALSHWDLVAKKRLNIIRVQNRRPDVDGEYFYTCRYWRSPHYNRKGKYVIVGGSGTKCLEVINIHNRYIACSYPAQGTINAVTSFHDRIAFGGSSPVLNIVSFHDPKHEGEDKEEQEEKYVYDCSEFD